jgi:hypothetical protein
MLADRAATFTEASPQPRLLPVHVSVKAGPMTPGTRGFLLGAGFIGLLAIAWHKKR